MDPQGYRIPLPVFFPRSDSSCSQVDGEEEEEDEQLEVVMNIIDQQISTEEEEQAVVWLEAFPRGVVHQQHPTHLQHLSADNKQRDSLASRSIARQRLMKKESLKLLVSVLLLWNDLVSDILLFVDLVKMHSAHEIEYDTVWDCSECLEDKLRHYVSVGRKTENGEYAFWATTPDPFDCSSYDLCDILFGSCEECESNILDGDELFGDLDRQWYVHNTCENPLCQCDNRFIDPGEDYGSHFSTDCYYTTTGKPMVKTQYDNLFPSSLCGCKQINFEGPRSKVSLILAAIFFPIVWLRELVRLALITRCLIARSQVARPAVMAESPFFILLFLMNRPIWNEIAEGVESGKYRATSQQILFNLITGDLPAITIDSIILSDPWMNGAFANESISAFAIFSLVSSIVEVLYNIWRVYTYKNQPSHGATSGQTPGSKPNTTQASTTGSAVLTGSTSGPQPVASGNPTATPQATKTSLISPMGRTQGPCHAATSYPVAIPHHVAASTVISSQGLAPLQLATGRPLATAQGATQSTPSNTTSGSPVPLDIPEAEICLEGGMRPHPQGDAQVGKCCQ